MPADNLPAGARAIQLGRGFVALIDEEDWDRVRPFNWCARVTGHAKHLVYAFRYARISKGKYAVVMLHRVLMNAPDGLHGDHINGDGLDNRKSNLRLATHRQNHHNRRKFRGASRFKGVHRNRNRWVACICLQRKVKCLGRFMTEEEAARAYDAAAVEHFGEFACTNGIMFGDY